MVKNLLFLWAMPLLLLSNSALGQAERTFAKSFNLMGKQTVILNLGDNVQILNWDSDLMRIQMTVSLATTNDATLKAFAETGRYLLKSELTDDSYNVSAPYLMNTIKLNGTVVKETISYIVHVPKSINLIKAEPVRILANKSNP
jgi:hypothetical protein